MPGRLGRYLTISDDGSRMAAVLAPQNSRQHHVLVEDVAGTTQRILALEALPARPAYNGMIERPEQIVGMALSPVGDLLALANSRHLEIWRLHRRLAGEPVLETILPLPFALSLSLGWRLEFSRDGRRLVLASTGALVWNVTDWHQVGRVPWGTFPWPVTASGELELTRDGSQIATPSGLWRIAPELAEPPAVEGS